MKQRILLVPSIGLFATLVSPLSAQDVSDIGAYEETEQGSQIATQPEPPPPPPALVIPPPASPPSKEQRGFNRSASLINYDEVRPKPADYPLAAWQADMEGTARYKLTVDQNGKPVECVIQESAGSDILDDKTCELALARSRFEPALDGDGKPAADIHYDYMRWNKREPEFPGTATIEVEYTLSTEGVVENCKTLQFEGQFSEQMLRSIEREPCPGVDRPPKAAYRDEDGNPVAKKVNLKVSVMVEDIDP